MDNEESLPSIFDLCGMDSSRIVTCWLTSDGERGTTHSHPITISTDGPIWPSFAGVYAPAERPDGKDICFFEIDHDDPDCNQVIIATGGHQP